jgi:hypothetical protein
LSAKTEKQKLVAEWNLAEIETAQETIKVVADAPVKIVKAAGSRVNVTKRWRVVDMIAFIEAVLIGEMAGGGSL